MIIIFLRQKRAMAEANDFFHPNHIATKTTPSKTYTTPIHSTKQ